MKSIVLWVIVLSVLIMCPTLILAATAGVLTVSLGLILFAPILLVAALIVGLIKKALKL